MPVRQHWEKGRRMNDEHRAMLFRTRGLERISGVRFATDKGIKYDATLETMIK